MKSCNLRCDFNSICYLYYFSSSIYYWSATLDDRSKAKIAEKGRRRKIRCIPAAANPSICVSCADRGSQCINQEYISPGSFGMKKTVRQRLARLKGLIESLLDERSNQSEEQYSEVDQHDQIFASSTISTQSLTSKAQTLPPISSLF